MNNDTSLLLKRPVTVKAIVTPRWKEEVLQQLQIQIEQTDNQIQQIDMQGKRTIEEITRNSLKPLTASVSQQIENIQIQVNEKKSELLERKNQALQQLQQVQVLELDQEVIQAQMESFFHLAKGDNLVQKMNVEIVMRDGIVEEIRGEI